MALRFRLAGRVRHHTQDTNQPARLPGSVVPEQLQVKTQSRSFPPERKACEREGGTSRNIV